MRGADAGAQMAASKRLCVPRGTRWLRREREPGKFEGEGPCHYRWPPQLVAPRETRGAPREPGAVLDIIGRR